MCVSLKGRAAAVTLNPLGLLPAPQMPGAVNRVLSLQLTAFWQNHGNAAIALGAAGACYGLWRALLGASSVFVDVGGSATGGMLAIAASGVAFGYLYLRRRYTIDPQVGCHLAGERAWAAQRGSSALLLQLPTAGVACLLPAAGPCCAMWLSSAGLLQLQLLARPAHLMLPPPLLLPRCAAGCVPAGHVPPQHTPRPAGGKTVQPLRVAVR